MSKEPSAGTGYDPSASDGYAAYCRALAAYDAECERRAMFWRGVGYLLGGILLMLGSRRPRR